MTAKSAFAALAAAGLASAQEAYNATTSAAPCSITTSVITGTAKVTATEYATADPVTATVTRPSYTSTIDSTPGFLQTQTVFVTSGKTTYFIPTATATVSTCTSTQLTSAEYTPTFYDGLYTSSALRTSCSAETTYSATNPYGTTTTTVSYTTPTVYSTVYTLAVLTTYYYSTTTAYVTVPSAAYSSGTTTSTESYACRTNTNTATASATVTQAAKCMPKNLIENGGVAVPYPSGVAFYFPALDPASKDASACCETCLEMEHCAGMNFRVSADGFNQCTIFNYTQPACEKAFGVEAGEGNFAQAGCGYIVQVEH